MSDDAADFLEHTQQIIAQRYDLQSAVHPRFWGSFYP